MSESIGLRAYRTISRAVDYLAWAVVGFLLSGILSMLLARSFPGTEGSTMASWFQAVGSIGAIIAAIAVASEQHRKDVKRRAEEETSSGYLLEAEIAWISQEIVGFINRYAFVKPVNDYRFVINDDEVADILQRLTWCRQRVRHQGQLGLVGDLRSALTETVHLVRTKMQVAPTQFLSHEIDLLQGFRTKALGAYNHMNGIPKLPKYEP
jgi:hypothetical protein